MARKLVTIRKVLEIDSIPKADRIEVATVDGWEVVTKKGEFSVGDYCLYFEIDSFLDPKDARFAFLAKNGLKKFEGKEGIRLRTIKLRKQVSQGLILPLDQFPEVVASVKENYNNDFEYVVDERIDFAELLNVIKYDIPEVAKNGNAAGLMPSYIPKTDEERCQNLFAKYSRKYENVTFVPSLKLDGSSITIFYVNKPDYFIEHDETVADEVNVASRKLVVKYDPETLFWKGAEAENIPEKLRDWGRKNNRQVALQGELVGPGVQKNRENFNTYKVFAFRVWDIDKQEFFDDKSFKQFCEELGISTTVQYEPIKVFEVFKTVKELLAYADGESINQPIREGVVFKSQELVNGQLISFKAISNKFLLKNDD